MLAKQQPVAGRAAHLVLALGLALLVAQLELLGRFRLLNDHHAQPRAREPLRMLLIIRLWEAAVGLVTLCV